MGRQRFTPEFKDEAVRQVTECCWRDTAKRADPGRYVKSAAGERSPVAGGRCVKFLSGGSRRANIAYPAFGLSISNHHCLYQLLALLQRSNTSLPKALDQQSQSHRVRQSKFQSL
jgi:hypothetical protein